MRIMTGHHDNDDTVGDDDDHANNGYDDGDSNNDGDYSWRLHEMEMLSNFTEICSWGSNWQ